MRLDTIEAALVGVVASSVLWMGCTEAVTPETKKLAPDLVVSAQALSDGDGRLAVIVQREPGGAIVCPELGAFEPDEASTRALMEALDGELEGSFAQRRGFYGALSAASLAQLSRCEGVKHISPNRATVGARSDDEVVEALVQRTSGAAEVQSRYDGAGVTVAVLDSGVKVNHKSLVRGDDGWVAGQVSFVDGRERHRRRHVRDRYGHGTLVAGALVSQNPYAPGVSPGASLLSLKVLNAQGSGRVSDAIKALDWLVAHGSAHGVRVVNISIASPSGESYTTDPLGQAVARVVEAGMVVVASAGNLGSLNGESLYGGIGSPANHPWVITVGASDSRGTALRADDVVADFSSRGPTLFDGVSKPDLIAPGVSLPLPAPCRATLKRQGTFARLKHRELRGRGCWLEASGTSFSAPIVAGAVALMLEANPALTPTQVKAILQLTAQPMEGGHPLEQGAGQLNIAGAVELAALWRADAAPGEALLTEPLPDAPASLIDGEEVVWGNGIIWNGYVAWYAAWLQQDLDVSYWGTLGGTGIIWNGRAADADELVWLDYRVSGVDLFRRSQEAYGVDVMWGDGIIWNGRLSYQESASFGAQAQWRWAGRLVDPRSWPSSPAALEAPGFESIEVLEDEEGWIHIPNFQ